MHSELLIISPEAKMTLKVVILCCLAALAHAVPKRVPRIAGGQDAKPGQYPYYVSLYHKDTLNYYAISFCGGTILNNQWILTAAYCVQSVQGANKTVVKAGNIYYKKTSETEQISNVVAMFIHPKYKDAVGPYDIGLMKLETPLKLNEYVAPINLPKSESIPAGTGTIVGLGSLKNIMSAYFPDSLQAVTLPIIKNDECQKQIDNALGNDADELDLVDELRFCTGPTETNQGYCLHDTGDPLATKENGKNVLIGVATFGFAADCETSGLPSIYTRVSAFDGWIQETISMN